MTSECRIEIASHEFLPSRAHAQGVSDGVLKVTAWPSALTVVAAWDRHKMHEYTKAICREERDKGTNVWLGPMVNLARVPMGTPRLG